MKSKANMKIKLCIFQFIYHTKHWWENFQLLGMKQTEYFKKFLKYSAFLCQKLGSYLCIFITFLITRVADPDPDPVFFAWIRIRFSNFPDLDPVSAKILENCRKVSKSDLSEENLKLMTKDRQKMTITISY